MFKLNGGDFPKSSTFSDGFLIWGFGNDKKYDLNGNIESIEMLPNKNNKEVNFTCNLKDGKKFVATCDTNTYKKIEVAKISSKRESFEKENNPKEKKKMGLLGKIVIGIFVFAIIGAIIPNGDKDVSKTTTKSSNKYIKTISNAQETKIIDELKNAGIEKIKSFENDEMLNDDNIGQKGYRVEGDEINNVIVYVNKDGSLDSIRWADKDMYKDGKNIDSVKNYYLNISEQIELKLRVDDAVKSLLKAPSTAKFPNVSEYAFSKDKSKTIIQGYVDSQNGFGAMLRSNFQVTISNKDSNVISFIFDGNELIKK